MLTSNRDPAYIKLHESGELQERVDRALELYRDKCNVCPRRCTVDRLNDETGACKMGRRAVVGSYFPHFGEEDVLRGTSGSGTIFFSSCNLRCVFCQNWKLSHVAEGNVVDKHGLADMMLELQGKGCHNINFVTVEHVVPNVLEALPLAVERGLNLPIVYNTSGYDSSESLELMDGIVDVYMPDFKYWSKDRSGEFLKASDYPEVARHSIKEMHRQVGNLRTDDQGLATRGLLLRHLVMPDAVDESKKILDWVREELSPDVYVNIMAQYRPEADANEHEELNRRPRMEEYREVATYADEIGLTNVDERSRKQAPMQLG